MEGYLGLTPEFFQKLIVSSDPGVTISSIKVSTGSGRGDNYTSMLYRVRAEGQTALGEAWSKSFICKILPVNRARREAFKSESLFRNEVAFYTRALPALMEFQAEKGCSIFQEVPKVYLAMSNILVLEDLMERGFAMADRKLALDVPHCEAILTTLGHFHGVSLAFKNASPETFAQEVTDQVSECLFKEENEGWYTQYYRRAGKNASHMLRERLEGNQDGDKYIARFDNFMNEGFFQRMIAQIRPVEPTAVLCHGDCWTNNFLFRYTDSGGIASLCMVDFQFARYGSPALDLVYLLFNCTTRALRSAHLKSLLNTYATALQATLTLLDCPHGALGPGQLLQITEQEVRRCSSVGLGLAVEMIPICTCDSEQAPDVYLSEQSNASSGDGDGVVSSPDSEPEARTSEACKTRITDLVLELIDNNII